ncbi:MAG: histidine kinase [Gemmatimonadaceae bacterium]
MQLIAGWLPVWALYGALIATQHRDSWMHAAASAARAIAIAALLSLGIRRIAQRHAWPHPFRIRFFFLHLAAAVTFAVSWVASVNLIESIIRWRVVVLPPSGIVPFVILGIWLYAVVAGITYATASAQRAALAEATAAQSQLAALRAQLHPHFLFNALHTVVQLIPQEPRRAAQAAEQIAALLRTVIEDDRDLVPLAEELEFVSRYLDLERLRFGDRMLVQIDVAADARDVPIPSFTLQTLIENAVRHAVSPSIEPTQIHVRATRSGGQLVLQVHDSGTTPSSPSANGTGLARLRRRLEVLYGNAANLSASGGNGQGYAVTVTLPAMGVEDEA